MEGSTPQDPLGPIAAVALEFPDVTTALDRLAEQLGTDMQITRLDRALTEQLNADLGIAVPVGSLMVRNAARTRAAVIDLHTAKVYDECCRMGAAAVNFALAEGRDAFSKEVA